MTASCPATLAWALTQIVICRSAHITLGHAISHHKQQTNIMLPRRADTSDKARLTTCLCHPTICTAIVFDTCFMNPYPMSWEASNIAWGDFR